jgi:Tfp pilus assembly protein PilF
VSSLALCAEGKRAKCVEGLRAAADREDASEKNVVTPGRLVPARELLAYAILDAGEPIVALREFETVLERDPNRLRAFAGAARAAAAFGNSSKAAEYSTRLVELTAEADTQLAEVAHARQLLGK